MKETKTLKFAYRLDDFLRWYFGKTDRKPRPVKVTVLVNDEIEIVSADYAEQ